MANPDRFYVQPEELEGLPPELISQLKQIGGKRVKTGTPTKRRFYYVGKVIDLRGLLHADPPPTVGGTED